MLTQVCLIADFFLHSLMNICVGSLVKAYIAFIRCARKIASSISLFSVLKYVVYQVSLCLNL